MRKGEKKLIEEYRKIEEKPENLEKLKNFLISFAKKRMDDYVINTSRRIIKLDPKSINYIIIFLSKYTLNYTIRQNYSHARWFLKKWNKLEIKGSTHRLLYKKIHYLTSKSISWYYFKVQGYLLLTKRKYNDAIKSLYKCSRLMDTEPSTHYQLASTYELIGKSEDALKEFNRCAGLAPLDPSSHYRIAYLLLEQKEYEKAFLEFQKTVEIYYEAKKNNSKRAFELAYIILDGNVGLIGETLYEIMIEAKILVHHCKGFSYLAKGNFTDAKGSFIQQNELIKKYKYSKFNFLLVLANLVEIDKKFFLLKDCSDFEHLIKEIIAISKELQPIERNSEVICSPLHSLFQVKLYLILFFLGALLPRFKKDFQKDEPKDDKIDSEKIFNLEYATGFFEYKNLTKFQQLINCLKNFALELKQYQNPLLEVPIKNQRQLIVSLSPSFNIIDGQLTTEAMPEVQKKILKQQIKFNERILKIEDFLSELPKKIVELLKKEPEEEKIKKPKLKEEKLEIPIDTEVNFSKDNNYVKINGKEVSIDDQGFRLLEELINRKVIHWSLGLKVFDDWREEVPKNPVQQFRIRVLRFKQALGCILIDYPEEDKKKKIKRRWTFVRGVNIKSTIQESNVLCKEAKKQKDVGKALELIEKALLLYPSSLKAIGLLINLLQKNSALIGQRKELIEKTSLFVLEILIQKRDRIEGAVKMIEEKGKIKRWPGNWKEVLPHYYEMIREFRDVESYLKIIEKLVEKKKIEPKEAELNTICEEWRDLERLAKVKTKDEEKYYNKLWSEHLKRPIIKEILGKISSNVKFKINVEIRLKYPEPEDIEQEVFLCYLNFVKEGFFSKRSFKNSGELKGTLIKGLSLKIPHMIIQNTHGERFSESNLRKIEEFLKAKRELKQELPKEELSQNEILNKLGTQWDREKLKDVYELIGELYKDEGHISVEKALEFIEEVKGYEKEYRKKFM